MAKETKTSRTTSKNSTHTVENVALKKKFFSDLVKELKQANELTALYIDSDEKHPQFNGKTIIFIDGDMLA